MEMICTSYTCKRNAKVFDLFIPTWCFMTKFNLGTVIITNANWFYFQLHFLHPRESSLLIERLLIKESGNLTLLLVLLLTSSVISYKSLSLWTFLHL